MNLWRRLDQVPRLDFLVLLLATDLLFVVLHLFHYYSSYFSDAGFSLTRERTFSEVFQYVKEYWIALLFLWLGVVRSRAYWAWASAFGYLLLDDSFSLHERMGRWVSLRFDFESELSLRPQDLGELTVYAGVGLALLSIMAIAYYRGDADFRRTSRHMLLLLLLLAFFGVLVDMIHIIVYELWNVNNLAGMLEDGGEMLVMSLICWYVLLRLERHVAPRPRERVIAGE